MTLGEWLNQMIIDGEAEAPPVEPGYRGVPARDYAPAADPLRGGGARSPDMEGLRQIVDQLTVRIEAAEQRSTLAISGVDQSVMGVLSRLEAVERDQSAVAARFDVAFDELVHAQDGASADIRRLSDAAIAREAEARDAVAAIRDDVRRVAERVDRVAGGHVDPASGVMDAVVSRIAGRLEEAEQRTAEAVKSLEASFSELDARLRASEASSSAAVDGAERRFEGLAADLAARVEASRTELAERLRELAASRVDKVEAGIQALQTQVEARERRSAQALDRMGREVMRIASSLSDRVARAEITSAEAVDRISGDVARLSGVLDQKFAQQEAVQAEALERLGGEISRIAEKLTERITHAERRSAQSVDDVGQQLGRLSERLSQRLDQSHSELSERLRQSEARTSRFIEEGQSAIGARLTETQRRADDEAASPAPAPTTDGGDTVFSFDCDLTPAGAAADSIPTSSAFAADPFEDVDPFELDPFADDPFSEPAHASRAPSPLRASAPTLADHAGAAETEAEFAPLRSFPSMGRQAHSPQSQARVDAQEDDVRPEGLSDDAAPAHQGHEDFLHGFDDEPAFTLEPEAALGAHDAASSSDLRAHTKASSSDGPPEGGDPAPLTTREILERARAAARQASERPDLRLRRGGEAAPKGSVPAPPLDAKGSKGFGFPFGKKKKKEGVTVRTALLASGTAAALAVTGAGALLLVNSEMAAPSDRQPNHFGVAPTAALNLPGDGAAPTAVHAAAPSAAPDASAPQAQGQPQVQVQGQVQAAVALAPSPSAPAPTPAAEAAVPADVPAASGAASSDDAAKALYSAGVRRISGDDFGGVDALKKAANLGYAPAQFYLAKLYETGGAGLAKDMASARRWTERAAAAGDPAAMHNLGLYFYQGDGGTQDAAQAAEWFKRAALLGVRDSQYNLALLYSKGYGVPQNLTEAYKWYLVAAISGDDGAKAAARAIRPQLSPDAQSAAERAAAAFKAQTQAASRATLASNVP